MVEKDYSENGDSGQSGEEEEGPLIVASEIDQPPGQHRSDDSSDGEATRSDPLGRSRTVFSYVDINAKKGRLGHEAEAEG